jgi:hypothetical protein
MVGWRNVMGVICRYFSPFQILGGGFIFKFMVRAFATLLV